MWRKNLVFFIGAGWIFMTHPVFSNPQAEENLQLRGWADPIGFCQTAAEIDSVIKACGGKESFAEGDSPWVAAICPHDDHLYAGPVYQKVIPGIRAKHIILLGVAHKAWRWGVRDRIIGQNPSNGPHRHF